ncbi:MAG: CPBP family intramembrane glutamic endopeptidase [Verrucomicrobiales bacterium]
MTLAEHQFIGGILGGLVATYFLLILPVGIWWKRRQTSRLLVASHDEDGELDRSSVEIDPADLPPPLPVQSRHPLLAVPGPIDLLGVGFYVLLFLVFWKMGGMAIGEEMKLELSAGLVTVNALSFLVLAGLIPALLFWRTQLVEFFGLRWRGWRWVFVIAPVFVFGTLLVGGGLLQLSGYPSWAEETFGAKQQEVVEALQTSQDIGLLVALAFSAVIVAPLAEEIIFRGYIYRVTRHYSGIWIGALFSGILFGVIHFNVLGFPLLALFGIVLALLYERMKTIWVPIACHAAFNGFQVFLTILLKYGIVEMPAT